MFIFKNVVLRLLRVVINLKNMVSLMLRVVLRVLHADFLKLGEPVEAV